MNNDKLALAKSYCEGIVAEMKGAIQYIETLDNKSVSATGRMHSLEMISDNGAHMVNSWKLVMDNVDGSYINMDAQPALDDIKARIKS